MKTLNIKLSGTLLSLALACGCNSDPKRDLPSIDVGTPTPLEGALLYLEASEVDTPKALVVDTTRSTPRVVSHELPAGVAHSVARPGSAGREVIVLTEGRDAELVNGKSQDTVNSFVVLFDHAGERWRVELPGRFGQIALSSDGRFAVAFAPAAGIAIASTVAVVDLNAPIRSPQNVELDQASGLTAGSFAFSAPEDGTPRLLVVRGTNALEVVELEHLERKHKRVQLTLPNDGRSLTVGEVIFHQDQIYVQQGGSSDVLLLQLIPSSTGTDAFTIAPLQLATESQVNDLELLQKDGSLQVIALGSNALTLLDPVTGNGSTTTLDSSYSRLIQFQGSSPLDDESRARALLVQNEGTRIAFVDFNDGTEWAQLAVEDIDLPSPVQSVIPVLDHKLVVLVYGNAGLALVDLEQRQVSQVTTQSSVSSTLLDTPNGEARLWLTLSDGRVGQVDLLHLQPSELLLNAAATGLLAIEGKQRRIAVLHDSRSGYVTLLDPEHPSRATARELVGFLYSRLFD